MATSSVSIAAFSPLSLSNSSSHPNKLEVSTLSFPSSFSNLKTLLKQSPATRNSRAFAAPQVLESEESAPQSFQAGDSETSALGISADPEQPSMADTVCYDCKSPTEVIFDHSAGDIICSECGLVLESHSVDETSEWRTFSDDSAADHRDPSRVGAALSPLFDGVSGHLSTVVSATDKNASPLLLRSDAHHDHLQRGFSAIADMADKLNLVRTISDRACVIFKKFYDRSRSYGRGRNRDALYAACLYIACQQENLPRTLKEICSVANGVSKTDLGRCKTAVMKELAKEEIPGRKTTARAGDYLKRFCSNLGIMENQEIRAAQEVARVLEGELDVRRTPLSVAAAATYIVIQFLARRPSLKEISMATGVSENTIRSAYKDLYPHLEKIVPAWFANPIDLNNLPQPWFRN